MNDPVLWQPGEQQRTVEELLALGEQKGRLEQARRLLSGLLARRIGAAPRRLRTAIQGCADLERLEQAVALAAEQADAAELQQAASSLLLPPRR